MFVIPTHGTEVEALGNLTFAQGLTKATSAEGHQVSARAVLLILGTGVLSAYLKESWQGISE